MTIPSDRPMMLLEELKTEIAILTRSRDMWKDKCDGMKLRQFGWKAVEEDGFVTVTRDGEHILTAPVQTAICKLSKYEVTT